ncbi:hypothetical protein Bca52824_036284 [Brassica carinata]|uniref:Subtilisin-like protease SBT4.3 n=1 Tax=Brassica carinata TaxID=52824 RepID=A0A8X7S4L1_BRACI|nr:hypothetical protein Bca52824_036284 [Brassica carinata]
MAKFLTSLFLICLTFTFSRDVSADDDNRQARALPENGYSSPSQHLKLLQELVVSNSDSASSLLIRSYSRSFNGFAAYLSLAESRILESMKKEVVSVFPSRTYELDTTRSWDFVGLGERAKRESVKESDVIIGVFDSGIWPESESFHDQGFGPPPQKWKGSCQGGRNFTCNNKLIGARFYPKNSVSARDDDGHGTHTASTAAGNAVQGASFYGLAQGTARGGAPSARVAAYKVCLKDNGCKDVDILAAYDDAIADGVDVISISISREAPNILSNSFAIGSFHAMSRGVVTVGSAGNYGPDQGTVANVFPWMITVAASATDRRFVDRVVLGNGKSLTVRLSGVCFMFKFNWNQFIDTLFLEQGLSVNPVNFNGTKFPIVYGQNVSRTCPALQASFCAKDCVDRDLVKGKIVLCDEFLANKEAYKAGAVGSIVVDTYTRDVSIVHPFPVSSLSSEDYESVKSYVKSTENPQAEILRSEEIIDKEAPYVPSFSSRGPSFIIKNLLKPDVSAPGLEILAAFSPEASPSDNPGDKRSVKFSVMSGTSMACPHVAGVAAYVKSFRPDWSPSAIKSAIMTSATPMTNVMKNPDQEFAFGSGHINPTNATDPGLVYELELQDYLKMLCAEGFGPRLLTKISGQNITCSERTEVKDLNYPTMTTFTPALKPFNVTFTRTVTNVGSPNSTFKASVVPPRPEIQISVEPEVLSFGLLKEKKAFVVTISGKGLKDGSVVSSSLVWSDGSHIVRSPIVAYSINPFG